MFGAGQPVPEWPVRREVSPRTEATSLGAQPRVFIAHETLVKRWYTDRFTPTTSRVPHSSTQHLGGAALTLVDVVLATSPELARPEDVQAAATGLAEMLRSRIAQATTTLSAGYRGPYLAFPSAERANAEVLTEDFFRQLASGDPQRLIALIRSGSLRASQLTFAAEAVGAISDRSQALGVLRDLVEYPSAVVREGVVYGLARLGVEEAVTLLRRMAESDPSPSVREVAADSIADA